MSFLISLGILALFIVIIISKTFMIVGQYEEGVVLTFGKFTHILKPGINFLIPMVQVVRRVDMRLATMEVPTQDVITSDNVSVKVDAVAYLKVVNSQKATLEVQNYYDAMAQLAQITLRATIGQHTLDDLLTKQAALNDTLSTAIDDRAQACGVHVSHVEIRSVDLNESMVRAMAQEAEAERGRRARVITAQGEFEAAQKLSEAADILARNPAALTLRTLSTLKEIGAEQNSVIIFPVSQDNLMGGPMLSAALSRAVGDAMSKQQGEGKDGK
ncbi:slipin family protein [Paludibacterium purpuratum]|uniref:SPFH domain-containing protein n=1 Tax=Paludibacterium purpuratum TaxID=1144873 RepID=A0A4R7AW70_9NEIS|nr:slipin family protein [Paludibacterium purpuratum]TDR70232.1 SPFH domain-containing protein [Paludibacterium purpuratum]